MMDAFVAQHLERVSRTYAIIVPMLPGPLAQAVGVAYLVMRIVDTIEDAPAVSAEQRRHLLDRIDPALQGDAPALHELTTPLGDTPAERELLLDASEVVARLRALEPTYRDAIARCAQTMSAGVQRLLVRAAERGGVYPAVRDAAELREYCYYVAGVVGEMLCTMMAHHLRRPSLLNSRELAVDLGVGLQLVNILKDAASDSAHGRRYLPGGGAGAAAEERVYRTVLHEARRCLLRGIDYVLALPTSAAGVRCFCGLPIAWGGLTLAQAERDPAAAKISREAVCGAIDRFRQLAGDDEALGRWLSTLIEPARDGANVLP